jgi:hypothetical protein
MGIFGFFKKDKAVQEENSNHPTNLNLDDPIIKKMIDWIEHPMEFNKKPDCIEIFDQRDLFWPTQKIEKCYLLKFSINNKEYIGFTGPISWCFLDIDFTKLKKEDLYMRYTGWFTVFATINSGNYNKSQEGSNKDLVVKKLEKQAYSDIEVLQSANLGGENYYEFKCKKDNEVLKVVGTQNNLSSFKMDHILPFFEFIGIQWEPFNLE